MKGLFDPSSVEPEEIVEESRIYRKIFVLEPGHDFKALLAHTGELQYVFSGYERVDKMAERARSVLQDFRPEEDALIPIGRVGANLVAGAVLGAEFGGQSVVIGVYKEKSYSFFRITL